MSHSRNNHGNNRRNRNYHQSNKNKINFGDKGKEILQEIDENNPVIKQFREYASELDDKHDRYERIVKFSRDITIESKRIIFLLHTIDKESKTDAILSEAKLRLENLAKTLFKNIANELKNQDPYQYLRAYTAGLQEYIEAITFYTYLKDNCLLDWTELDKNFCYVDQIPDDNSATASPVVSPSEYRTLMTPNEYILGVADLTGELMRKCINTLAFGDITSCYKTCNLVKEIYKGFLGCAGISGKEIRRKLYVLKQSLVKMENVCYTIKVRGSEMPKHMLADVAIATVESYPPDDDEGYQPY
ncbi:translin-associated protein X [Microplitis demolitor]|uniref:translin-associated protein X n=1 Tax=Microplitis demolitor TaxID=69319 RepID=UPI0004CD6B7E|nr:translin-associated protein X [Microplitis demolitor]